MYENDNVRDDIAMDYEQENMYVQYALACAAAGVTDGGRLMAAERMEAAF